MAWPHGSAASRRRDDARARATGPSRRGATAAAATGLDAARRRRASDVRRGDGVVLRLRESRENARTGLRDGVVHAGHRDVHLLEPRRAALSSRCVAGGVRVLPGPHARRGAGHAAPETPAERRGYVSSKNDLYPLPASARALWEHLATSEGDTGNAADGKVKCGKAHGLR